MTQILPADDSFDLGPASVGTYLGDWINCLPDSGSYSRGNLTDAYSQFIGSIGVQGAVASAVKITGADVNPRAWVTRRQFTGAVRVSASFFMHPVAGPASALNVSSFGVLARYQGGSISSSGTTGVHFLNGSCYIFDITQNKSTFVMTFALKKVASGTVTTLASTTFSLSEQTQIDWFKPFELILEVAGTTTVGLVAKVKNVDLTGGGALGETIILNTTDTTSTISGNGRPGFIMAAPRSEGLFGIIADVADVCEWFEVSDATDPANVYFRDEWERLGPNWTRTFGPDTLGFLGRCLQGGYSSDQYAYTGTTSNGTGSVELIYNAAGEEVRFTGSGSGIDQCVSVSQRPAGDARFQHRSATVNLASTGGGRHYAGILLRGSWTDPVYAASPSTVQVVPTLKGYLALAQYNAGGPTYIVQLYRYSGSTRGDPLKLAEVSTASALWTAGADFTLDFDIYPVDGSPDPNNAPTELVVTINGTQVALESVGANGIDVSSGGTVVDNSSGNIPQGPGEGFVMFHSSGSTTTTSIDDWTEEALHVSTDVPPNDQATITIADEGTAVGTITDLLLPEWQISVDYVVGSEQLPFESGHTYAESLYVGADGLPDNRRIFTFTKRASAPTEHHALEQFYDDHLGHEIPFNYVDRRGNTVKVCFAEDSLVRSQNGPNVFGTTFQLVELF